MRLLRRVLLLAITLLMILPSAAFASTTPGATGTTAKIDASLRLRLQAQALDQPTRVIVRLRGQPELSFSANVENPERQRRLVQALKAETSAAQTALKPRLDRYQAAGKVLDVTHLWIINACPVSN